jgi:enoyl-CoA hydratase/carnithine racemase
MKGVDILNETTGILRIKPARKWLYASQHYLAGPDLLMPESRRKDDTMKPATAAPETVPGRVDTEMLEERVGLITINSEARLNAFSEAMRRRLTEALRTFDESQDVRAIVLTGAGSRAFSAGQDLSEAQVMDGPAAERWVDQWGEVYSAVLGISTPTVAALNGYAVGAGLQTALMCDVRVASTTARAGMPEINDAIPCITGTWALEGLVGDARIADLVQTGRMLDAQEMADWGLVTYLAEPDQLLAKAGEIARLLATNSQRVFQLNKFFLRRGRLARMEEAIAVAKASHRDAFASGEPAEAMHAFLTRSAARPSA